MPLLFSIVVPAYNIQEYIAPLLTSCLQQEGITAEEYEIIVVDDGSSDNTATIARELLQKYPHASCVIQQTNAGPGVARNTGMAAARGQYIWFVDADDWVAPDALSHLRNLLREEEPDMCQLAFCEVSPSDEILVTDTPPYPRGIGGRELLDSNRWTPMVWAYLYKRSFLQAQQLLFTPEIYHEDEEFNIRALYQAKWVAAMPHCCYYYRLRQGSIMRTISYKRVADLQTVIEIMLRFRKEHPSRGIDYRIGKLTMANIIFLLQNRAWHSETLAYLQRLRGNREQWYLWIAYKTQHWGGATTLLRYLPTGLLYRLLVRGMRAKRLQM